MMPIPAAVLSAAPDEPNRAATPTSDRLNLLLESTGEGIFGIDLDGRCTFMNRPSAAKAGWFCRALFLGCLSFQKHLFIGVDLLAAGAIGNQLHMRFPVNAGLGQ